MLGKSFIIFGADSKTRVNQALKIAAQISQADVKLESADVLLLEAENSLGIDKARQTKRFLQTKPFALNYKIVIIKSAHKLTVPAQNALLKTLEEPSGNNLIFLLTRSAELLLPTVLSRCQLIHLPPTAHCPLPTAHCPLPTAHCPISACFSLAEQLSGDRQTALAFLDQAIVSARALLLSKYSDKFVSNSLSNSNEKNLSKLTIRQLTTTIHQLNQTNKLIKKNVNPRLALENLFLNLPLVKTR